MARVEAVEKHTCDSGCGSIVEANGQRFLVCKGWLILTWNTSGRKTTMALCPKCRGKVEGLTVLQNALENTRRGGVYGPEADCG